VDPTDFWRPTLQNGTSKHYHLSVKRALPALIFGIVGEAGEIGGQWITCPRAFESVDPKVPSENRLWADLLRLATNFTAHQHTLAPHTGRGCKQVYGKRSFGTHSKLGSLFVERILTAILTLRQQKLDVLELLTETCHARNGASQVTFLLPTN
jgi:hypothetical protein